MFRPPEGVKGDPRGGPGIRMSGDPELPGRSVCGGGCGMPGRNPGPLILGAPKMLASEPMVEMGGYGVVRVSGLETGMLLIGLETMGRDEG